MRRDSEPKILVNRAFARQRLTGQQRYAAEIAVRLLPAPSFAAATPGDFWSATTLRTWAWVQGLPARSGRSILLSLTSRAPLWARRQIIVVHDLFVLTNPEWFSTSYHRTHAPLLRAQLRSAEAVIAVSETTASDVQAHFGGPVVVAPNAPSDVFRRSGSTSPEPESTLAQVEGLRGLGGRPYFLAVGNLEPRKNLTRLAAAFGSLSEAERRSCPLVVVGAGDKIYSAQDIAWPTHSYRAGYLSDDQLAELYRGARAVVLVSLAEGFGLPLVEAAAAGARHLVLSDLPVFRWICGDDAVYVEPTDERSIAAGLLSALDSPPEQRVDLARFDWERSADTVRSLCLERLDSR